MTIQLTSGDVKTVTVKFFDGAPDANGNPTGNQVNTPAQVAYSVSDPAVLNIAVTSADVATWHVLKAGTVTVTVTAPAATDANNSYSAFTGNVALTAALLPVTILSFQVNVA